MKNDDLPPTDDDGWGDYAPERKQPESTGEAAEPKAAEPRAAEPKVAEPKAAEPKAAEPRAAEPKVVVDLPAATAAPEPAPPAPAKPGSDHAVGKWATKHPQPSEAAHKAPPDAPIAAGEPARAPSKAASPALKPAPTAAPSKSTSAAGISPSPAAAPSKATSAAVSSPSPAAGPPKASAASQGSQVPAGPPAKKGRKLFSRGASGEPPSGEGGERSRGTGGPSRPRFRRLLAAAAVALVGGLIALSVVNHREYHFICHPHKITAERGSLWPWGRSELGGPSWRAIPIEAEYNCRSAELDSENALAEKFAETLIDVTEGRLAREDADADVEALSKQLDQALLLTRGDRTRRERVDRLRGDVDYRHGRRATRNALTELQQAQRQFDAAAKKRPIHASDAGSWSRFAEALAAELSKGPHDLRPEKDETSAPGPAPSTPPTTSPPADDSDGDVDGNANDQAPPTSAPDATPPPSSPAAQPTRGGVLL